MPEQLKPCPFCNAPAVFRLGGRNSDLLRVTCSNPYAPCVSFYEATTGDEAKNRLGKRWNERPAEDALNAHIIDLATELIPMGEEEVFIDVPRALTWGKEPKLGEWNWWRSGGYRLPRYVYTDGTIDTTMMGRIPWQDIGGEWAGPIQEPGE